MNNEFVEKKLFLLNHTNIEEPVNSPSQLITSSVVDNKQNVVRVNFPRAVSINMFIHKSDEKQIARPIETIFTESSLAPVSKLLAETTLKKNFFQILESRDVMAPPALTLRLARSQCSFQHKTKNFQYFPQCIKIAIVCVETRESIIQLFKWVGINQVIVSAGQNKPSMDGKQIENSHFEMIRCPV